MPEPSVLDYVKEKLTFWKKGSLSIPDLNEDEFVEGEGIQPVIDDQTGQSPARAFTDVLFEKMPWRLLGAFGSAFVGQFLLEPNSRDVRIAIGLYVLAFGLLVWSWIEKELPLFEPLPEQNVDDPLTFRSTFAMAAVPLAVLTFLTFRSGLFDELNTLIWLLAILCFIAAVIRFRSSFAEMGQSIWRWLKDWPKQIHISGWTVLLIAVWVIILFFRIYHLKEVPPEMTSDHAEKLQDVEDVLAGLTSVFFPRNTGREAIQFYLTAAIIQLFHTGVSFLSLKIGTVFAGLVTLPFIYLAGKEFGNRRIGLIALLDRWNSLLAECDFTGGITFFAYIRFLWHLSSIIYCMDFGPRTETILSGLVWH